MRRVLLVVLGVWLFFGGCAPVPFGNSLAVTDELRSACQQWTQDDAELHAMIADAEASRMSGVAKYEEQARLALECTNAASTTSIYTGYYCTTCGMAVLDQVFGSESTVPLPNECGVLEGFTEFMLVTAEEARLLGAPKEETRATYVASCSQAGDQAGACTTCVTAIVDAVYDK